MRMRHLSVLLVAMLALALGGCLTRGQSVQQTAQAAEAVPLIVSAPGPLVSAAPTYQAVFTHRDGKKATLAANQLGKKLIAAWSLRPDSAFELFPEATRLFKLSR